MAGLTSRRSLACGGALIAVTPPRYLDEAERTDDLVALATELANVSGRCRAAAALRPVALWAAQTRSEKHLRRVAEEIVKHGLEWQALAELALAARAVLAAKAPEDEEPAGAGRREG